MEPLKSEWLSYSWPYCDKGKLIAGIFAKIQEEDFEAHIFFFYSAHRESCSTLGLVGGGPPLQLRRPDLSSWQKDQGGLPAHMYKDCCKNTRNSSKRSRFAQKCFCHIRPQIALKRLNSIPVKGGCGCTRILAKLSKNSFESPTF